jgi:hypothetical protein
MTFLAFLKRFQNHAVFDQVDPADGRRHNLHWLKQSCQTHTLRDGFHHQDILHDYLAV